MKQPTSKDRIIEALRKQENRLINPIETKMRAVSEASIEAVYNSAPMAAHASMYATLLDSLKTFGLFPDTKDYSVQEYKDICYESKVAFNVTRSKLYDIIYPEVFKPYEAEYNELQLQKDVIRELYRNITQTVRSLTPAKAKQYVMELQLNIPVEAFMDQPVYTVLPDNPILQAVRSQLLTQLEAPNGDQSNDSTSTSD